MLLQRLQRCHNAPNAPSCVVGSQQLRRHRVQATQQAAAAAASRCSSTTNGRAAATAAQPGRRWRHAEYTSGLGSLLASSQLPQAVALVDTWLDHKQRVHGVATGELLEALCSAAQHDTAWCLLRRLTAAQARLPLQVLHRLLKLAGQFGSVDDVLAVYAHQQQLYGFASVAVQTTLVHALLKASSKAQRGHLLAYEAWARLKGSGRQLDAQALLAGMHACVCVGQLRTAEELLEPLRAAAGPVGRPLLSGYNLLLKGHAAAGNAEAARRVFGALTSRGLSPDAVSYNTLLSAVARAGEWGRAAPLLQQMRLAGVAPDAWSFTTLAAELGKQGQLGQMQAVLQDMAAAGVAANSATYAAVINAHAAAGDIGAAEQLLEQLLSSTSDVNLLLGASRSSSSSSSDSSANRNGNSSSDSASSMQAGQVGQAAFTAAGLQAAAGGPLLFDAAAGSNGSTSGSNGRSEQLQQGLGSLAGGTRNSRHVLRHQYNSLIKGWLRLAADAHAAANSAAPGQQWLPAADAAGSNGGSRTSSSWNGALQAAEVQRGRAGLLQQMPRAPPPPVQQQLQQPAAATRAAPGYSGAAAAAAAVTAPVGAASSERSPAAARPASRSALLQSMPALIRPVLPPQPQAAVVQVQPAHATAAPNGTAGAVHSGSSSSSVAPVVVVSRQAATFGEALAVLQRMQAAGVAPAADTYTLFIHYCIKVGDASWLQHMLSTASASGVQPDQVLLTTLIKAAWQVEDRAAAIDVFNALLRVVTPFNSSSSKSSSPVASMDGSSSDSTAGHAGTQQQQPQQQQQQHQHQQQQQQGVSRPSVSQAVRAYANAAAASAAAAAILEQAARSTAPASSSSSASSPSAVSSDTTAASPAAAGGEPAQQPRQPQKLQQQQQRGQQQLLLPLTAPKGPDAAAWNALAAAMARTGQLDEAARAVERGAQAAAACGASRPPIEGFAALVRGYRRARLKEQAVSALRHFLNLGGRPVRVMCDDVVALCLEQGDVRTGRQVVRAMELTGCLGEADASFYAAWFARWEAGRAAASASRYGAAAAAAGGGPGIAPASSNGDGNSNASAVERLKWWLGLPNSYYSGVAAQQQRAEQAQADARARATASGGSSGSSPPDRGAAAASQLQQPPPTQAGR